eukprot:scaffold42375_cov38-Prasinocladus_malaysianus.AAC.1
MQVELLQAASENDGQTVSLQQLVECAMQVFCAEEAREKRRLEVTTATFPDLQPTHVKAACRLKFLLRTVLNVESLRCKAAPVSAF